MRLLSLSLQGQYKGLKDQSFSFDDVEGNIIAFIGLNGSGKSQLLELIAETFGYLERYLRGDFKCRNWFETLALKLRYSNQVYDSEETVHQYSISIDIAGKVQILRDDNLIDVNDSANIGIEEQILPSHIVGYSSGLNETLQRPFMKNAVQYLDVMNIKRAWELRLGKIKEARDEKGKRLTESDLEMFERQFRDAYGFYHSRHPALFPSIPDATNVTDNPDIGLRATPLPRLKYLDHDTTALMLVSMGMMNDTKQKAIWNKKQRFNKVHSANIRFDLRKFTYDAGALLDIAKLIKCISDTNSGRFTPRAEKTKEEFFNQFELDYLAGEISIGFSDLRAQSAITDAFFEPKILFEKLYRLQLLAAGFWLGETRRQLRQDDFKGAAKKPQKWKSPIQVTSLKLTDGNQCIEFEDLSDGEAQLIQILSMAFLYKDSRTLFLLDEPETHLNPSWRTYFHAYLDEIINDRIENKRVQMYVSTHSPFMVSSLKRNNVYQFHREDGDLIKMSVAQSETYGASFDVLIKELFDLKSLISQSVIDEIRRQLTLGDSHAKNWIESNLGPSPERAYLIRKLS